jgi:DNA-binding transcriptional MerR regulator
MFRIGEFSRIGCVTIDTLRHYDALDLLTPAKVDPFTGYRYYSAKQLQSLNRIIALKEVGFSLEEIARILRDKLNTDELRGMLKAQLVSTESAIESAQLRRERILARLNYLTLEENMPAHGYRMVCAPREFYYGSPEKGDLAAEIQFPVEKV